MTEIIDSDRQFRHGDLSRVDGKILPNRFGDRVAARRDVGGNAGRGAVKPRCLYATGLPQGVVGRPALLAEDMRPTASKAVQLNARSWQRFASRWP